MKHPVAMASLASPPKTTLSRGGVGCICVFFSIFLLMGLGFTGMVAHQAVGQLATRFWPATPCEVLAAAAQITDQMPGPYTFTVRYRYEVGGRAFESQYVSRDYRGGTDYADVQRLLLRLPVGTKATCYVNPRAPQEAVLRHESPWFGLTIFFPLIFVAIGGGGVYLVLTGKIKLTNTATQEASASNEPLSAKGKSSRAGHAVGAVFFGVFGLAGLGVLAGLFVPGIIGTVAANTWPAVPCTVVHSRLLESRDSDGTTYRIDILYEYRVGEQVLRSNTYHPLTMGSSGAAGKRQVLAAYPPGAKRTCRVNPRDPPRAVLAGGFSPLFFLALIPVVFIVVGVVGVRAMLRTPEDKLFSPGGGRRSGRPAASGGDPAARGGALVLQAKVSPFLKFLGFCLLAGFWNGITSIFVWQVIQSFRHGRPEWFMAVMISPFVLVGLGLLAGVTYYFLALFNPRPQLRVESNAVRLGQTVKVQWRFRGSPSRIRQLTIKVLAREEATFRRGTDTSTSKAVFLELPLVDTADPRAIPRGQLELAVPATTMHSLSAPNNKIVWVFSIHGDIKRWPDVSEEIEFTVLPQEPGRALKG